MWPSFLHQTFGSSTLCQWVIFSTPYRWWSVVPSANAKDYNSYCNFCAGITKVEICVTWIVHLHLCLLGCACCLLGCWLGCHMFLRVKGITKMCAIRLQPRGEHKFLSDLSVVCAYYLVWNFRWKAMYLPTCAIIVVVSLGVVICVVYGHGTMLPSNLDH
jgi:hypothetical protein